MKVNTIDMRSKILGVIREIPAAANNDKLLIAKIWYLEGWNKQKDVYENLKSVSSPETIRRTRQKLVEEGLVKPSVSTTEYRYEDFKQARMAL